MDTNTEQPRDILWRLVKDIKFSMFTTRHGNGHFHARPMTTQNKSMDHQDLLWFFISKKGETVADLRADSSVNITYADSGKDAYVSVSGNATVVDDLDKKNALWTAFSKPWFPCGPEDADLALVQVKIIHAHYWDVKASKVVQLYEMAKSAITGKQPENIGNSGEVRM